MQYSKEKEMLSLDFVKGNMFCRAAINIFGCWIFGSCILRKHVCHAATVQWADPLRKVKLHCSETIVMIQKLTVHGKYEDDRDV